MPAGLPHPQAVLRGHRGEVQALDFDCAERCLVSGDSLGEVRVWDLADLRPAAVRRLHPLSGGILSLRLFRSAGAQMLGTQGRDGAMLLWSCTGDNLQLSDQPVRGFFRDSYSFCRFDVLSGGNAGSAEQQAGACSCDSSQAAAQHSGQQQQQQQQEHEQQCQQEQQQQQQQLAAQFVAAVLADNEPLPAVAVGAAPGEADAAPQQQQGQEVPGVGTGSAQPSPEETALLAVQTEAEAAGAACAIGEKPPSAADVGAAIWALHACGQASAAQPPALVAIPGCDERTAEVVCAACGQQVAEFREAAADRKLGMLMAVQLYCRTVPAASAASAPATTGGSAPTTADERVVQPSPTAAQPPALPKIWLAAGYEAGSVAVWEVGAAPGAPPLAVRQLCTEPVMALAVDSSAAGGVCGSAEEQVVVFKIDYTACRISVRYRVERPVKNGAQPPGKAGVGDVAVRPDRRLLATAGWDGRVRLYKYRSGRPLAVLKYHSSPVTGLCFAPQSMLLATAARDGTVALWPLYQPSEAGEDAAERRQR